MTTERETRSADTGTPEFESLLTYLRDRRGFDFTGYKRASLNRRIDKRMQDVGVDGYDTYIDFLEVHPEEFAHLFNTILINVTGFFRGPAVWDYLRDVVVPDIVENKDSHEPIRVWSAACASGEEPFTAAMVLCESLGEEAFKERVKIYATDVDDQALDRARAAGYSEREVADVPPDLRERYFEPNALPFHFRPDLRRAIIFGRHDLLQDAPISRIDLLLCRNTLMYFNAETQARILHRLHFSLRDGGYLVLGKAEMLLGHPHLFTPVDIKHRVFTKVVSNTLRDRLQHIAEDADMPAVSRWPRRLVEGAFEAGPTAQIVVDHAGFLTAANARARQLFDLRLSDVGRPFQDVPMSYRPVELRSLIEEVRKARRPSVVNEAELEIGGQRIALDIELVPLAGRIGSDSGVLLAFVDVTGNRRLQEELEHANRELETAYEELQSTNEELETTNEELQSTVEELETTNEELQSTNEELETMNEELQSTNDELQVINDELRRRTVELDDVNAFLESILTSLRGGVIVVDTDLVIQVWSPRIQDLWGLLPDEVVGAHLGNLDIGLPVDDLLAPVRSCLHGEQPTAEVTARAVDRRGRRITCAVCVTPLRGSGGAVRGAILLIEVKEGSDE